jgi:hypothetical protein
MKPKETEELKMREEEVPWPTTIEDLTEYIQALASRNHDYGTCVYAMSMAAVATFNYMSRVLGVTGFQASCADLDILRRTRSLKEGFMIINYENLLFPQYCDDDHFPTWPMLLEENKKELAKAAKKHLKSTRGAHPDVIQHWKMIAALVPDKEVQ